VTKNSRAFLKALSGVLANLSGAWFALALVTPNFGIFNKEAIIVLTFYIIFAIIFLVLATIVERILDYE